MAEYLCWQVRNILALRGVELVAFGALVVSGVGLYYSLKFLVRDWPKRQHNRAVVFDGNDGWGESCTFLFPLPESSTQQYGQPTHLADRFNSYS